MPGMLPKRADPVAGALVGTLVLTAFLALPVLVVAAIVWLLGRATRSSSSKPNPDADQLFRE
jgi:hypothetical protein